MSVTRRPFRVALVALLAVVAACSPSGSPGDARLVRYERVTSGIREETIVFADGRVQMTHGEALERFTLAAEDLERIRAALVSPIATVAPAAEPRRTLTLGDGTVITSPSPEAPVVVLLDELTDTHGLADEHATGSHGAAEGGSASPPSHAAPAGGPDPSATGVPASAGSGPGAGTHASGDGH